MTFSLGQRFLVWSVYLWRRSYFSWPTCSLGQRFHVWFTLAAMILLRTPHAFSQELKVTIDGVSVPSALGELPLNAIVPERQPGQGVSLNYQTPEGFDRVTIYVYTFNENNIQDGCESESVQRQVSEFGESLVTFQKRGLYAEVEVKEASKVTVGGITFLRSWATYELQGVPSVGYVYVTGWKGKFLKIRGTFQRTELEENEKQMGTLLEEIVSKFAAGK